MAKNPSPKRSLPVGYIVCSDREKEHFASMLLDICKKLPAGRMGCGETVNVVQRHGDWLEIAFPDNRPRYLPANMASQSADKFVPFDTNSGAEDKGAIDCPVPPMPRELGPRAIYAPDPEYSEKARKMKISGSVILSLIVGIDGLPHDVKVEKSLGYGLDEKAWRQHGNGSSNLLSKTDDRSRNRFTSLCRSNCTETSQWRSPSHSVT